MSLMDVETIDQADAEIARWVATEHEWDRQLAQAEAEAATIESELGALALEDAPAASVQADRLSHALIQVRVAESAISEARTRRLAAWRARWDAEAAALEAQADERRQAAAQHQQRTRSLLAALKEHEEVDYTVAPHNAPEARPVGLDGLLLPPIVPRTRSERMLAEADALAGQAFHLRSRQVPQHGSADAGDGDALVDLATGEPGRLGPPAYTIRRWVRAQRAALAGKRTPMHNGEPLPAQWQLRWANGRIDEGKSRVAYLRIDE